MTKPFRGLGAWNVTSVRFKRYEGVIFFGNSYEKAKVKRENFRLINKVGKTEKPFQEKG